LRIVLVHFLLASFFFSFYVRERGCFFAFLAQVPVSSPSALFALVRWRFQEWNLDTVAFSSGMASFLQESFWRRRFPFCSPPTIYFLISFFRVRLAARSPFPAGMSYRRPPMWVSRGVFPWPVAVTISKPRPPFFDLRSSVLWFFFSFPFLFYWRSLIFSVVLLSILPFAG